MKKAYFLLALFLAPLSVYGELGFKSLSVTDTSQTYVMPVMSNSVLVCNYGTNDVYYRLFMDGETTGAATTSNVRLVAGTSGAPICISYTKEQTTPASWRAISIICSSGQTATVHLQFS